MSIESYMNRRCVDTAVYWGTPIPDRHGQMGFAAPVEIKCLWLEVEELVRTDDGKEIISNASVYVIQDLGKNGMLYHGTLADLSAGEEADPKTVVDAYEIKRFVKTPSINLVGEFSRKAMVGWRR